MKKVVSLLLSLALCFSLIPSVFAVETVSADNKFTDVPKGAWYLSDLNYALANGYISGTSDNTFSPEGNITRGQFVTILGRMLGVSATDGNTKFYDVASNSYYAPYVGWAAQHGYVNGTSDTTFAPESLITFEQMGTILANFITKSGATLSGCTPSATYKDESSISAYAVESMEMMRAYGLLHTDSSGNVRPQTPVNRAEGTVSLVRLAKATGRGEVPTIKEPEPPAPEYQKGDGWKVTYQWASTFTDSLGTDRCEAIVEVANTGSVPIYLKSASMSFYDITGHYVGFGDEMFNAGAVVMPGDTGVFYTIFGTVTWLNDTKDATVYRYAPELDLYRATEPYITYAVSDLACSTKYIEYEFIDDDIEVNVSGVVTNTTSEDSDWVDIYAIFYNDANQPVAVSHDVMFDLAAGESRPFEIMDWFAVDKEITSDIASCVVTAEESYGQLIWG